ncbi:MAG: excinuclease ABC subunit UvrC [Patescibacteria group bacterium]|nr:excinuclease ABC subunit UvrC [Patescibacteria group bacterium]
MDKRLKEKVRRLPRSSGVYIYRDKSDRIIYVGKAVNLKNRVSSYFSEAEKDPKTEELVRNIVGLETIECGSEFEALVLEADLIKRYKPKYNVRFKDDKNYVYLKITKEDYPRVSVVHQITDSNARYLGPFIDSRAVRAILKVARKIFPYCTCTLPAGEVCLYYHIGLCPGHDDEHIDKKDYQKNIKGLVKLFSGKTKELEGEFKREMKKAAKEKNFEGAAMYRDRLRYLDRIKRSHFLSDRDLAVDKGLAELKRALNLKTIPSKIESFDISNIMGNHAVGSMVVFRNGVASPKDYRRFEIRTVKGANDFAMMSEVVARRFKKRGQDKAFSDIPDLVILDGGKGQLSAVIQNVIVPDKVKITALAKKKEEIFVIENNTFERVLLSEGSEARYLVQRIRDEAHRFAITYHKKIRDREVYLTSLDNISGVGPKTKKKLLLKFSSVDRIKAASVKELEEIVGKKLARKIKEIL